MLQDWSTGLEVFGISFVLGQILDNAIVPKVMSGIVGVNPIWVIIAVFMGAKLGGLVGILIAVPVASIIKDVVDDLLTKPLSGDSPDLTVRDSAASGPASYQRATALIFHLLVLVLQLLPIL